MILSMPVAAALAKRNDGLPVNPSTIPPLPTNAQRMNGNFVSPDDRVTLRDSLANLLGKGYTSLNHEDIRGDVGLIQGILGQQPANKLLTSVLLYNQSPYIMGRGLRDRISGYYSQTHGDKDVASLVERLKAVGYGPLASIEESPNVTNMELTGRTGVATGFVKPPMKKED